MNILVIMGSPRRKNTYRIANLFKESLTTTLENDVEFKYVFLQELQLNYCRGCFVCTKIDEQKCPHNTTVQKLFQEMKKADGIIFCSPVYVDNITALMKNFIDHFSYLVHRPCFFDKSAIILSTTQGSGLKMATDYMEETFRKWGFNVVGKIGVKMPLFNNNKKNQFRTVRKIDALSRKLIESIENRQTPSPTLKDLISFRVMRVMLRNIESVSPKDKQYWTDRGWLDKKYYVDVRINFGKNLIAGAFEVLLSKQIGGQQL